MGLQRGMNFWGAGGLLLSGWREGCKLRFLQIVIRGCFGWFFLPFACVCLSGFHGCGCGSLSLADLPPFFSLIVKFPILSFPAAARHPPPWAPSAELTSPLPPPRALRTSPLHRLTRSHGPPPSHGPPRATRLPPALLHAFQRPPSPPYLTLAKQLQRPPLLVGLVWGVGFDISGR